MLMASSRVDRRNGVKFWSCFLDRYQSMVLDQHRSNTFVELGYFIPCGGLAFIAQRLKTKCLNAGSVIWSYDILLLNCSIKDHYKKSNGASDKDICLNPNLVFGIVECRLHGRSRTSFSFSFSSRSSLISVYTW